MDESSADTPARDAGARRIIWVLLGVSGLLLVFYAGLAYQAYAWHPANYAENIDSEISAPRIDPALPAWTPQATSADPIAHGRALYLDSGCAVCHGIDGKSGIKNPNYQRGDFPPLNAISKPLFLRDEETYDDALALLSKGIALDAPEASDADLPRVVSAQFANMIRIIENGNPASKAEESGVAPIPMPAWKDRLTHAQMRDILAYLVSLQDRSVFEEEEEDDDDY